MQKRLILPVKKIYFDEINNGHKKFEYRLYNDYWKKRIIGKDFFGIEITLGYPKKDDHSRRILRLWKGYDIICGFIHNEFGTKPVTVFAIKVND